MFGFLKKHAASGNTPSKRITDLSRQGMTEPQIISELRQEGYKPGDVDRGFRDAIKHGAVGKPLPTKPLGEGEPRKEPAENVNLPPLPRPQRVFQEPAPIRKPRAATNEPLPGLPPMPSIPENYGGGDQLLPDDELRDEFLDIDNLDDEPETPREPQMNRNLGPSTGMLDKRVDRIDTELEELTGKLEQLEGRLHTLEQQTPSKEHEIKEMTIIKESAEKQQDALKDVNLRMEALEKAVTDSLTPMMQTMRSLSDTIKSLKGQ